MQKVGCIVTLLLVFCCISMQTAAQYYDRDDPDSPEVGYRGYGGTGGYNGYYSRGYGGHDGDDESLEHFDSPEVGTYRGSIQGQQQPCALSRNSRRYKRMAKAQCCTPNRCSFADYMGVRGDGFCKTAAQGAFKTNVGVQECQGAGCTCYAKGCFPGVCTGVAGRQGICKVQQAKQQSDVVNERSECLGDCKCYTQGCNPRDCTNGNQPGICSKDGPQGVFSIAAGQQGCAAGCICYTKDLVDACNDKETSVQLWGKHICNNCMMVNEHGGTMEFGTATSEAKSLAEYVARVINPGRASSTYTVFAAGRPQHINFKPVFNGGEYRCEIIDPIQTWQCTWDSRHNRYTCQDYGLRTATLALSNGHLVDGSLSGNRG